MTQDAKVNVCIEYSDGSIEYKNYSAPWTITRLKRWIKVKYRTLPNVVHVGCGNGYYVTR